MVLAYWYQEGFAYRAEVSSGTMQVSRAGCTPIGISAGLSTDLPEFAFQAFGEKELLEGVASLLSEGGSPLGCIETKEGRSPDRGRNGRLAKPERRG